MKERDVNREFWEITRFSEQDERDPIELAAADMRLVRAARYLVIGEIDERLSDRYDYMELLAMIRDEYLLSPEEVNAAMSISEDRVAGY